jgi:hypothetical protein
MRTTLWTMAKWIDLVGGATKGERVCGYFAILCARLKHVVDVVSTIAIPDSFQSPETEQQQIVARSRWQNLMIEAGMTAGGIGAAVSEESMKSLKYCLQWLQVRFLLLFLSSG